MLAGEEILDALGSTIIIHPFDRSALRGSSYNLKVGKFVWFHREPGQPAGPTLPVEWESTASGRRISIPPGTLVSALTKEVIRVDKTVAGIFHSKVDMVTKGFSHVSTKLDPEWIGPLLITIRNSSPHVLVLWEGETFVTLTFHRLRQATGVSHNNPPGRSDLLGKLSFVFPNGEENFLDAPVNCNLATLREEFLNSPGWKELQRVKGGVEGKRRRMVILGLAIFGTLAAVSAPSWFPLAFGIALGDQGLVAALVAALGFLYIAWREWESFR